MESNLSLYEDKLKFYFVQCRGADEEEEESETIKFAREVIFCCCSLFCIVRVIDRMH